MQQVIGYWWNSTTLRGLQKLKTKTPTIDEENEPTTDDVAEAEKDRLTNYYKNGNNKL